MSDFISVTNDTGQAVSFATPADFHNNFMFGKSSLDDCHIAGVNFNGGYAYPLLDFTRFHKKSSLG